MLIKSLPPPNVVPFPPHREEDDSPLPFEVVDPETYINELETIGALPCCQESWERLFDDYSGIRSSEGLACVLHKMITTGNDCFVTIDMFHALFELLLEKGDFDTFYKYHLIYLTTPQSVIRPLINGKTCELLDKFFSEIKTLGADIQLSYLKEELEKLLFERIEHSTSGEDITCFYGWLQHFNSSGYFQDTPKINVPERLLHAVDFLRTSELLSQHCWRVIIITKNPDESEIEQVAGLINQIQHFAASNSYEYHEEIIEEKFRIILKRRPI